MSTLCLPAIASLGGATVETAAVKVEAASATAGRAEQDCQGNDCQGNKTERISGSHSSDNHSNLIPIAPLENNVRGDVKWLEKIAVQSGSVVLSQTESNRFGLGSTESHLAVI
jgi:hypothetical protein